MQTVVIIKPDATRRKLAGEILRIVSYYGDIKTLKCHKMTLKDAKRFYAIHKSKPFYNKLCEYMTTYVSIFLVIDGRNVVQSIRRLIENYIRPRYGIDVTQNSIHGSDSLISAEKEIQFVKRLK